MNFSEYIKFYADLLKQEGNMVLANKITIRPLDRINCDFGVGDKVFNFYIIQNPDFLIQQTYELHIYGLGITVTASLGTVFQRLSFTDCAMANKRLSPREQLILLLELHFVNLAYGHILVVGCMHPASHTYDAVVRLAGNGTGGQS